MRKMKRRLLSLVLSAIMVVSFVMQSFAQEASVTRTIVSFSENGVTYQIVQEESMLVRRTYLYDNTGTLLETLIFYKDTGVLTNPNNGKSIYLDSEIVGPCVISANGDYEYEFCSLGDSIPRDYEITVGEIMDMLDKTVINSARVVALIAALTGIPQFAAAAYGVVKICADTIVDCIRDLAKNDIVYLYTYEVCTEQWESDSSYPNGGFYFLGYLPDNTRFDYEIVPVNG